MKTTTLEPGAFLAARLEKLKRQNRWMKCAVAEVELLVSTEALLCPSCRQGRLVLTETWPRSNTWLPWPATFESVVLDRPMHNTFEEFMARRQQLQPTAKRTG